MKVLRFFDPLYGRVDCSPQEWSIIRSPEIQRLRYIRMCNINSLLLSGASEISQFEHILGVFRLAQEWTQHHGVTGSDAEVLHAAALLHDFQTGPFGHSMEYILADNEVGEFRHEDVADGNRRLFLQTVRQAASFAGAQFSTPKLLAPLWSRITEVIRGEGRFGPLIAGTMDLDNIDNVVRLALHVGVARHEDAEICLGLARDLEIAGKQLSISGKSLELVHRWQSIRTSLYRMLLHDWAEFSAKAMLTAMIELAVVAGLLGPDSWVLTDDGLMALLGRDAKGENQKISEIGRRLMRGDLYEPLALWRTPSIASYKRLARASYKREVERLVGAGLRTHCIFHVILDNRKVSRQVTLLNRDSNRDIQIGEDSQELLIGVFVSRSDQPTTIQRKVISTLLERLHADGIEEIKELDDPLEEPATGTTQLSLFS
jgi:HD superfamily phosphohydrolase